ncbi:methyl-accepting chemotaxis protein [Paenibacillus hexagrammi]|uniref:Methyl-accepting chemotaxis protein n=1 Tax=Paenibacillus hexagrammi TaxID=2908839 RepID=A0ABY3SFI8_9BACL|nr:methyl-accepting chemotaxis protein [Paenibacillus sp. YPD9-1]UJF32752.1 methyl-accepting chemotaxis protein [Paenibacillus sp. YPD9-1]
MQNNRGFWKITIRKKLLLISLFMLLVPVSILGYVSYHVSSQESDALIRSNLQNSVKMALELTTSMEEAVKAGGMTKEAAQEKVREALIGPLKDGKRSINPHIQLGENGYFFILNANGDLMGHPLLEGQNILDKQTSSGFFYVKDMIEKAKGGGGFTTYDWPLPDSSKEAEKIAYAESAGQDWGWIIAAGSYMQDYNQGQTHILNTILITLLCCWVIGGTLMTLFALHISRPIKRLADQASQFAQGDLRASALNIKNKDEIGDLAVSFQAMYVHLREMVAGLLSSSDRLSDASHDLSGSIGETTLASNQISVSIQDMAGSNDTQARSVKESSVAMEEMAYGIQRIATTSSTAYEASEMTLREAEQGNLLIKQSSEQMNAVNRTVSELAEIVEKLTERSQYIGDIVRVITDISAQTNLLALNASIEAARAGAEGKGFAVVAGEVKKLAERSTTSAAEVAELIEAIQEDMRRAGDAMAKGEQEVAVGVQSIEHTGQAFVRILEATRNVVEQVQEASASAQEMSASSQEISASLQDMERMADQTNQLAQQISASTEEQLAVMEELSSSAESLNVMSSEMQVLAHKFKL